MRSGLFAVAVIALSAPVAITAATPVRFDVAPGNLRNAIVTIGDSAGVTIGLTDPALGDIAVRGVHGRMPVAAALSRLLAGTQATFSTVDAQTFRILPRPAPAQVDRDRAPPLAAVSEPESPILVTGNRRPANLEHYPGSAVQIDPSKLGGQAAALGSQTLLDQIPALSSTHLGQGRNKLFIRGVADSSFTGLTQATVGEYLGDVRLNYSAPDPDLALYDLRSVEVLEGPQGTLYGAGSLGGVIRLEPMPPDLTASTLEISAGGALTAHGAPGADGAAIGNLPLIPGRLALRVAAYGSITGGYIDDPERGLSNINRTTRRGGRATLRFQPADGWTVDFGGVLQDINSRDGQYSERGLPPLTRNSVIAQPFDNDYSLADIVVHHAAGATKFVSATSIVIHDIGMVFDASPTPTQPTRYTEGHNVQLITNETRLSRRTGDGGGWVVGIELLHSADTLRRTLGAVGSEGAISGTRNTIIQGSLYGEATVRLAGRLYATGGGRAGYYRLSGEAIDAPDDLDRHAHNLSFQPSAGLLWKIGDRLSAYLRYEEAFRPGGLSVASIGTEHFDGDRIKTWEGGLRYGGASDRFSASAIVSYANWRDIQADLLDAQGFPYTANIGLGQITGLELRGAWRPVSGLTIEGALFRDDSDLSRPTSDFLGEKHATLPNVPASSGKATVRYSFTVAGKPIETFASATYVGRSRLGVGTQLDLYQGRYWNTAVGLGLPVGRMTVSLDATNLLDHRGNVFAFGNPFGVANGNQITPLQPRTIRLGAAVAF